MKIFIGLLFVTSIISYIVNFAIIMLIDAEDDKWFNYAMLLRITIALLLSLFAPVVIFSAATPSKSYVYNKPVINYLGKQYVIFKERAFLLDQPVDTPFVKVEYLNYSRIIVNGRMITK